MLQSPGLIGHAIPFFEVSPRAEESPLPGQHHGENIVVTGKGQPQTQKLTTHICRQGVSLSRARQGDQMHTLCGLQKTECLGHWLGPATMPAS